MTAQERADQLWNELPMGVGCLLDRKTWTRRVADSFEQHAHEQRQIVANLLLSAAHLASDAPSPGVEKL